jgi:hypothetical protein
VPKILIFVPPNNNTRKNGLHLQSRKNDKDEEEPQAWADPDYDEVKFCRKSKLAGKYMVRSENRQHALGFKVFDFAQQEVEGDGMGGHTCWMLGGRRRTGQAARRRSACRRR